MKDKNEIILIGAGSDAGLIARAIIGSMPKMKVILVDEPPQIKQITKIAFESKRLTIFKNIATGKENRRQLRNP